MGKNLKPLLQVAKFDEHCCAHADSTVDGSADGGNAQPAATIAKSDASNRIFMVSVCSGFLEVRRGPKGRIVTPDVM